MTAVTFVHSADWQLGMTRRYLVRPGRDDPMEAQSRFTADRIEALSTIGRLAADEGTAFVLAAGDVFETNNVSSRIIGRACEAMAAFPALDFYLLPGNHDPRSPHSVWDSPAFERAKPGNVHVLGTSEPVTVAPGVELVAAPWRSKHPDRDPVSGALGGLEADGTVRILVGHGMLEELQPDRFAPETVRRGPLDEALADGRIHYVALGDRHIAWPEDPHAAIRYPGTPESTDFAEPGRGTALLVRIDTAAEYPITATVHEVGRWRHITVRAELGTEEDLNALVADFATIGDKPRTVVRTAFTGSLDIAGHARLEEIEERQSDLLAGLRRWDRHTELSVNPDVTAMEDEYAGYAGDTVRELAAAATRESAQGTAARDALILLDRLAGGRRIAERRAPRGADDSAGPAGDIGTTSAEEVTKA